jgi:DNA helicase HerA-like ATPase
MKNWYNEVKTKKQKLDKNFKKHHVLPKSMILALGGTGTGKTNALMDLLDKKNDVWHNIIIFNPNNTDEPLYNLLQSKIPDVELINDIDEGPHVQEFDDKNKSKSKLIVFDDFINLNKKQMAVLADYAISSRKFAFTCVFMSQSYTSIPKIISRNCNYIMIFKIIVCVFY